MTQVEVLTEKQRRDTFVSYRKLYHIHNFISRSIIKIFNEGRTMAYEKINPIK